MLYNTKSVNEDTQKEKDEGISAEQYKEESIKLDNISRSGAITTKSDDVTIHSLVIAGQVEGHYALSAQTKTTKYEHVIPQLVEVEENPEVDGLLMLLNTVGGDVEAGLAISELVAGMKKPTVSLVLGGGHSIGVPLAVSAKKSFIVPSATMTIHPVRMNGLVIGVPQAFTYFTRMQRRIVDFIVRNSSVDVTVLNKLMLETDELVADVGSVIDGKGAVDIGLIDSIGTLSDALCELKEMIKQNRQKNKTQ